MSPIARIIAAGAALSAVAFAGVATAQNYSLNPTYGVANLSAGFTPDPYVVNVQSGGSINAANLSPSCRGYIADAEGSLAQTGDDLLKMRVPVPMGVHRVGVAFLKRTWVTYGHPRDWADPEQGEGEDFLREALQVKNIWTPFGE